MNIHQNQMNLTEIRSGYLNRNKANQQQVDATNYYSSQGTPSMGQGTTSMGLGTSVNPNNVFTDPQFAINSAVAVISENDKPAMIRMLQKQGSFVTPLSSKSAIIDATFKAIQDSPKFREELQSYIVGEVTGTPTLGKGNYDNFANGTGKTQTRAGEILSTIFSQENISTALGLGMGVLATRMNEKAKKGGNQQAIDFEKAQTEKALAQAKLLEAQGKLPQVSSTPEETKKSKWVMPVAIGGGILLLGTIIYFVMKKKK